MPNRTRVPRSGEIKRKFHPSYRGEQMESRRTVLKSIAGMVGASACNFSGLASFAEEVQGATEKPNIVCIVGEGLRWDELSSMGNQILHTPNMDRIGKEGCTFKNAF